MPITKKQKGTLIILSIFAAIALVAMMSSILIFANFSQSSSGNRNNIPNGDIQQLLVGKWQAKSSSVYLLYQDGRIVENKDKENIQTNVNNFSFEFGSNGKFLWSIGGKVAAEYTYTLSQNKILFYSVIPQQQGVALTMDIMSIDNKNLKLSSEQVLEDDELLKQITISTFGSTKLGVGG